MTSLEYHTLLTEIRELKSLSNEVMTLKEAAAYLRVKPGFLYKDKSIPKYEPNQKLIRYRKTDLDNWLNKFRISTKDEIDSKAEMHIQKKKAS